MIISLILALLRIAKSTISVLIGPLQLVLATQVKPAGHVTLGIQMIFAGRLFQWAR